MSNQLDIPPIQAYRGSVLHFIQEPNSTHTASTETKEFYQHWKDGLLLVEKGLIKAVGEAEELLPQFPSIPVKHFANALIMPGFIDTHTHYAQMNKIASQGNTLVDWLNQSIFPEEAKFNDKHYADQVAKDFLDTLLENGTSTAMVFCTIHTESVNALFEAAQKRNMRIIAGKVMMDRAPFAPPALIENTHESFVKSQMLIEKWHNKGRASYAVTPRFAITSSSEQLKLAGQLLKNNPGVYLQTHLSENTEELAIVANLYPDHRDYLDIYEQAGLMSDRSVFAHAIHLSDDEWARLAMADSAVSFCPCSNFFLGSGIPNMKKADEHGVKASLGTDIGAGTSFSMLSTMNTAYQASHLQGEATCPLKSFYLATLGGAKALKLDHEIGNFQPGKAADFIILDLNQPKILGKMQAQTKTLQTQTKTLKAKTLKETLSAIRSLGDDRTIQQTFIMGKPQKKHP